MAVLTNIRPFLIYTLVIGGTLSIGAYLIIRQYTESSLQRDFQSSFNLYAESLERELQINIQILRDLHRFFLSSQDVTRVEFTQFTGPIAAQYESIQALEWVPRVPHSRRAQYESTAREEGFVGFEFTERHSKKGMVRASERPEYYPVYFVEPLEGNRLALGFDLASSQSRFETLDASKKQNKLLATAAITLVQEKKKRKGFLVFIPVYGGSNGIINGFVLGVYSIGDISKAALKHGGIQEADLSVTIIDQTDGELTQPLFVNNSTNIGEHSKNYNNAKMIEVGGRQWLLQAVPTKLFLDKEQNIPAYAVLCGGIIITLLVFSSLYILTNREREISRMVKLKTAQLRDSISQSNAIVETALDAIVTTDDHGRIDLFNPAAEKMFGYSADEIARAQVSSLISSLASKTNGAGGNGHLSKRLDTMAGCRQEEQAIRASGQMFPIDIQVTDFEIEGAKKYLGIIRDITERKEIERVKSEFVSTVSHELRTPLTSIRASLGMIASNALGDVPDKVMRLVTIAEKNTERVINLVNDILDIEKLQAESMEFNLKPLLLNEFIESVLDTYHPLAQKSAIKIQFRSADPSVSVMADGDRLSQVISNLLSNAIKFSPKNSTITIAIEHRAKMIRVLVSDQGRGVPKNFQDKIFGRFKQADSSDTRQKGGTGLGLNISREIIKHHGGTIGFDNGFNNCINNGFESGLQSEQGKGATFYFELPSYSDSTLVQQNAEATIENIEEDDKSIEGSRVLILEDDPDVAQLLSEMLEHSGFSTDTVHSAMEAKKRLSESHYAAMTVDIMLPDQDGISLIREIRLNESTKQLATVVVSAKAEQTKRELVTATMGIVDWIDKPIDKNRLLNAIRLAVPKGQSDCCQLLYVEDDEDLVEVVGSIMGKETNIVSAGTLKEAKDRLAKQRFDLVLLDITLPDGSGLDLLPMLNKSGQMATPVVIFSANHVDEEISKLVSAALIKSQTSNGDLVKTIRSAVMAAQAVSNPGRWETVK
jgi:PAS domain S-box-containing protein